jgi:hypothetical protein
VLIPALSCWYVLTFCAMCRAGVCSQTILRYAALSHAMDLVPFRRNTAFIDTFGIKRSFHRRTINANAKCGSAVQLGGVRGSGGGDGTDQLWEAMGANRYRIGIAKEPELGVGETTSAVFHSAHGQFPPPWWLAVVSFNRIILLIAGAPCIDCLHIFGSWHVLGLLHVFLFYFC